MEITLKEAQRIKEAIMITGAKDCIVEFIDYPLLRYKNFLRLYDIDSGKFAGFSVKDNIIISDFVYDQMGKPSCGKIPVRRGNQYNYLNLVYFPISKVWFDEVYPFQNGFGIVKKNGNYHYIDAEGNLSPSYQELYPFNNGIARIKDNGRYYFINKRFEKIREVKYPEGCNIGNRCYDFNDVFVLIPDENGVGVVYDNNFRRTSRKGINVIENLKYGYYIYYELDDPRKTCYLANFYSAIDPIVRFPYNKCPRSSKGTIHERDGVLFIGDLWFISSPVSSALTKEGYEYVDKFGNCVHKFMPLTPLSEKYLVSINGGKIYVADIDTDETVEFNADQMRELIDRVEIRVAEDRIALGGCSLEPLKKTLAAKNEGTNIKLDVDDIFTPLDFDTNAVSLLPIIDRAMAIHTDLLYLKPHFDMLAKIPDASIIRGKYYYDPKLLYKSMSKDQRPAYYGTNSSKKPS